VSETSAGGLGLYDLDRAAMTARLDTEPAFRVDQLWQGLYHELVDVAEITTLPKTLREHLATELRPALRVAARSASPDGDTVKWLWALPDGAQVETVLMHYDRRSTACVSTQAGCAMACGFCATGQAGFERNLSVGEIVEQVIRAAAAARPRRLSNVVFMGMGEPLANYDRMWSAVERIHEAMDISARRITISTVGIVPGIRRLSRAGLPINLAVSLHAANDRLRDELVPINRRYPLAELLEACRDHFATTGRRVSFEWALIAGVNDRIDDVSELAEVAASSRAHVNLIPLNPTPGYETPGSPPERVEWFRAGLVARGVNATVRQNRGTEIDAACGQLRASAEIVSLPDPTTR